MEQADEGNVAETPVAGKVRRPRLAGNQDGAIGVALEGPWKDKLESRSLYQVINAVLVESPADRLFQVAQTGSSPA